MMKGLASSRSHHHMIAYDPSYDPVGHHIDHKPYLISQVDIVQPAELPYYNAQHTSYPCDSNNIVPYGTFPRRCHSTSSTHHPEVKDESMAMVPYVGGAGGGYGGKTPTRVPANFGDSFEQQQSFSRDGYHTLQYKRGMVAHSGGIETNNNDSPGRIRHLVHSVQKLFTKSHSLEGPHHTQTSKGPNNGSVNGGSGGGGGGVSGSRASPEGETPPVGVRNRKRSKSRERCRSAEPKHRSHHHHHHQLHGSASAPGSGYWSSDDNLERELCLYTPHHHQPPPSPSPSISLSPVPMTMSRYPSSNPEKFPQTPLPSLSSSQAHQYFMMDPYGTISEHAHAHTHHVHTHHHQPLKVSRSSNDVKFSASPSCIPVSGSSNNSPGVGGGGGPLLPLGLVDGFLVKKGTCSSSLTVPQDEWSSFSPLGKEDDIPCRRMRSGSYVKAMAEDDSGDSDGSPKPSPKVQARRASYLKATQPSLTEMTTLQISTEHSPKLQIRSHSYLRAVSEVSINRSLDTLDPKTFLDPKMLLSSPQYRSRNESYMRAMSTISQVGCQRCSFSVSGIMATIFLNHTHKKGSGHTVDLEHHMLEAQVVLAELKQSVVCQINQDAYMEEEGPRGDMTLQSRLSNSSESIDSMKALTAAIEAANAQVHGPASQHVSNSTITPSVHSRGPVPDSHRKEALRKSKCLSIGIQVDGPEEIHDPDDPSKFTSVGVQVEDNRGYRRFQRSNSVTAAVQADLDMPDLLDTPLGSPETDMDIMSPGVLSRRYSRDGGASTVSIQGSGNHYHACASDEYEDVGFDPSILPPPDPWIDSVTDDPLDICFDSSALLEAVQRSVCQRDGRWFLKLLHAETDRMEGWCRQMEMDQRENDLPEDILGKIRSAVGSAQLLMSQKFQQFKELCEENLNPNAHPRPVASDLAGFWDMLQLSIENISLKFDELHQLRANGWRPLDPPDRKERRLPPQVPKKPPKGPHHHPPLAREHSLESSEKQRQEARKRLIAAKRAASVRQNSATESADSIEIYIPEAQTRL
ncbi:disks large-associated protein 1 [Thalassophryne amazonica]|uniref:disks large-associated protein 1 n=1 Tax=Thalassophryne amazonica TaxID=390379 RepID=UPI00147116C9|nr:disks large-associated protein 1 [Thalassophryne amazonica]